MTASLTFVLLTIAPADEPKLEFFEAKVRPLLVEHCQSCHGPKKAMAGLRLDRGDALRAGGDSGPAVVPGRADDSLLIRAIRHDGDLKMPAKAKLPDAAIAIFTDWVNAGAVWPADRVTEKSPAELAKTHWAFQPVRPVPPPAAAATPVDAFVEEKLRTKALTPSPPADRRTILRRVTYDLIGLPPSSDELEAFVNDPDSDDAAYAKVVERLLASPRYGERWGRHWLDVARYADTRGYLAGGEERRYAYAYTYRDFVIRAFNDDMPYDQFVRLQIAADRYTNGADKKNLAALGFLTLGRRFINNAHDIIDDRIDVVTRGLLGLTVSCARCHDHKFDPVPTADYYSLYGVFSSSTEPKELPLLAEPEQTKEYAEFERKLNQLEAEAAAFKKRKHQEMEAALRRPADIARYLLAARDTAGKPDQLGNVARERDLKLPALRRWGQWLVMSAKRPDPLMATWHRLAKAGPEAFAAERPADFDLAWAFAEVPPRDATELAAVYGMILAARPGLVTGDDGPATIPDDEIEAHFSRDDRNKYRALRTKADRLKATSPAAPPRAHVLVDADKPGDVAVFVRGNPGNRGAVVPRRFPEVVSGPDRRPFRDGSGRKELAEAIASPANPLTARVMVNRVWHWHFGRGLVATTSDFGLRSDPPSHPELLDYLADQFVKSGWSVKSLHRLIVLSRTYRQASADRPECASIDPENVWLWRSPRRRLEFEALRDSILTAAGSLDPTPGGPPVDITKDPSPPRRSVYAYIDRQNLPGLFPTFDFASPNLHSPYRFTTTVPQQALYLMNSPFIRGAAAKLAGRSEVGTAEVPADKVRVLYRLTLGREPTPAETEAAVAYTGSSPEGWARFAQVLLMSNEFTFID